ncbi:MAG: AAA family ATPase, partial [Oscillospiraceae bacterium]|nr:AAA family ATPase [Oscillospiraceae bacterium]
MIDLYLKSLEIQGFKSFPEKTRLSFEKPITGIVGPNGSGKSNISDAILWVMGEQSTRVLRGGKMEDVIFGGTQRRTQVGFAEVSLILDNSDGRLALDNTEVMITRRYYRSGESEYYINRSLVRLKDVNELLMDTGLGREGYSVIGQGRIDEVLSTKSKDRREIFEEAAGISRYRHRKEESERKLSQTDENLIRIGDKISELELQVEPLREQAETARKYLLFRDELRGLEISVWMRELDTLKERAEKAESDHTAAKLELDAVSRELESGFAESESSSENMHQCDVEADTLRESLSSAEARQNNLDSAAAVLKSQLEGNAEQIERLLQEIQDEDSRQDGVGARIASRESRLEEIAAEKKSLNDRADALMREQMGISESAGKSSNELSVLLKTESDIQGELQDKRNTLSALASQAQELLDRENSMKREMAAATENLSVRTSELDAYNDELIKVREETASLGNVVSGLAIKAQNRSKKAEMSGEKLDRITHEMKTLESRRNLLAEMEKDFRGYSRAVKLIMQESLRGALKNIHGTAASLIKTGDRYAMAIETALGGAVSHIIVDSEEDGKAAINYLKRHDGGRATFLPLSTIKGGVLNENEVSGDAGFEGVAINLVEFDAKYADVYANLLGRVIIADDLNSAVRIAKKHGYRFR